MKTITLNTGENCLVDDVDYPLVSCLKWYKSHEGYAMHTAYIPRPDGKKGTHRSIRLHRLILNAGSGQIVDHIDGNKLNNTRSNLRFVTQRQNQQNARSIRGTSRFKGVCFHKPSGKWKATIKEPRENGSKHLALGMFATEAEAGAAYDAAALRLFGEYAATNQSILQ